MLHVDAHPYAATLKDMGGAQPLLGCASCADRRVCGKLHLQDTGSLMLSCMDHCTCSDPTKCEMVCPRNAATFANRHHEVDGWDLNNIPAAQMLAMPRLPSWIPLFQGDLTGKRPAGSEPFVALPLTLALTGSGFTTRGRTADELVRRYGARPAHGWVLSGTEGDPAVERVWKLPDLTRVARQLRRAVAFEFLTGSATRPSADVYVRRLKEFSHACGRAMPLVMRGRADLVHEFKDSFSQVILLDSAPYMRATKRRKAFLKSNGALGHSFTPTSRPKETRALLLHNLKVHRAHADLPAQRARSTQGELDLRRTPAKVHADDESIQLSLFSD